MFVNVYNCKFDLKYVNFIKTKYQLCYVLNFLKKINNIEICIENNAQQSLENAFNSISNYLNSIKLTNKTTSISSSTDSPFEISRLFYTNQFYLLLIKLIKHLNNIFENNSIYNNEKKIKFAINLQNITNYLFQYSIKFRYKYIENNGLIYLVNLINNKNLHQQISTSMNTFYSNKLLINLTLLNIANLAKDAYLYKSIWTENNVSNILIKNFLTKSENCKFEIFAILLLIASNDDEILNLSDLNEIIETFIGLFHKSANYMINHDYTVNESNSDDNDSDDDNDSISTYRERILHSLHQDDTYHEYDVLSTVYDRNTKYIRINFISLMLIIHKLSLIMKLKYDLFIKYKLNKSINIILSKGTYIEKIFTLKLLVELCYDECVLDSVSIDKELIGYLKRFILNVDSNLHASTSTDPSIMYENEENTLIKLANIILSCIKKKTNQKQISKQILISYDFISSNEKCIQIKSKLESFGLNNVFLSSSSNNDLNDILNRINSSDCVLICVNENYKHNLACKLEAEYAFKLGKPIIPLIIQENYENVNGWLGLIMSDLIYINFCIYSFETCIKYLLKQIELLTSKHRYSRVEMNLNNFEIPVFFYWTQKQVETWFKITQNEKFHEMVKPCNGELLYQLFDMYKNAPLFFKKYMIEYEKIDFNSYNHFLNCLNLLID